MTDTPFQACLKRLEAVARDMWQDGVQGKTLQQSAYLFPMADALVEYERAITKTVLGTKKES